jgi:hypothetical protein
MSEDEKMYVFHCPGCGFGHAFKEGVWQWNRDFEKPTITPSILAVTPPDKRCHSFITDGKIRFLPDCSHNLKGQTVDLPVFDEDQP